MKALTALKLLAIIFAVVIVALLGVLFFYNPAKAPSAPPNSSSSAPSSFEAALVSPDGALEVATSSLRNGALVASPLTLSGTVTGGGWFYEATFPVEIVDASGMVIGSTTARAETDWTSTGTVPWTATLDFGPPRTATGEVIFMSDNPSGDPSKQKMLAVPVNFE